MKAVTRSSDQGNSQLSLNQKENLNINLVKVHDANNDSIIAIESPQNKEKNALKNLKFTDEKAINADSLLPDLNCNYTSVGKEP